MSKIKVNLETLLGNIVIELDAEKAPITVANFIKYVEAGFFDGTIFHRVIPGFMVQGGGFNESMEQKSTEAPIENEADNGLGNIRGSLAMARTNDPHSATGQFFINLVDNDFLNHSGKHQQGWGYAVFGQVVEGMEIVDEMAQTPTGNHGHHQNVPLNPIIVTKATKLEVG